MRQRISVPLMLACVSIAITGCASKPDNSVGRYKVGKPYSVNGKTYYPGENYTGTETGMASWYGPGFDGKKTANGERFDQNALTAAHPTLQMPSLVRVTNLQNDKSVIVRVNDRGPFHGGRVMDLSKAGAEALGFRNMGTAKVKLQVLGPESIALAEAAKRKVDTRGAEIAMNQTGTLDARFAAFYPTLVTQPQDATMIAMGGIPAGSGFQPQVPAATTLQIGTLAVPDASDLTARPPVLAQNDLPLYTGNQPVPALAESVLPPLHGKAPLPPQIPGPIEIERVAPVAVVDDTPAMIVPPRPERPSTVHTLGKLVVKQPALNVKPAASPSEIYVQVGAYLSQGSANILRDQLSEFGTAHVIPARPDDKSYFRVRIGPLESVEKADYVVDTLKSQGRQALVIAPLN